MTTRRLLVALLFVGVAFAQGASAQLANWEGPPLGTGDWFDGNNWSDGVVPNSSVSNAYIFNGGTARLGDGDVAIVRSVRIGESNTFGIGDAGRLEIDHATLLAGPTNSSLLTLINDGSVYLNNATIQRYDPESPNPSIVMYHRSSLEFAAGTYDFRNINLYNDPGEHLTVTVAEGVELHFEGLATRPEGSAEFAQNGGAVSFSQTLSLASVFDYDVVYNMHGGTLGAFSAEIGYTHPFGWDYVKQGVFNQFAGEVDITNLDIGTTGRYNKHGGTLHIEHVLSGEGVLDFKGESGSLTIGDAAQLRLADLSIINAQQVSISGGQNGVLYVDSDDDPAAWFGSFSFGGLVVRGDELIHVQSGQDIVFTGPLDSPLLIEGAVRSADAVPTVLKGPVTVRGTLDFAEKSDQTDESIMIVDGHASRLESGFGRFNAIVGDGGMGSRLELLGGEYAGQNLYIRGVAGGDAEVVVDGATIDRVIQLQLSSDDTPGSSAKYIQHGGEVTMDFFYIGSISNFWITPEAVLNHRQHSGGSSNEMLLDQGGVINTVNTFDLHVGSFAGGGTFRHVDGTVNAAQNRLILANSAGYTGTYELSQGLLTIGEVVVGNEGQGRFYQEGGNILVGEQVTLGWSGPVYSDDAIFSGDGYYRLNGGSLEADRIVVGNSGTGLFEQNGGLVRTRSLRLGLNTSFGLTSGEYQLNGGTLEAEGLAIGTSFNTVKSRPARFVQTGGVANLGSVTAHITSPMVLLGGITNISHVLNIGLGTLDFGQGDAELNILEGANAYLAAGSIVGGVNATFHAEANTLVTLPSGFDLSQFSIFSSLGVVHVDGQELVVPTGSIINAAGTVNGDVLNNGGLAPGSSPGLLTINGNLVQSSDAALFVEIGGTTAIGEYDQVYASESIAVDGELRVSLYEGFVPEQADAFEIILSDDIAGEFSNIDNGRVSFAGGSFAILHDRIIGAIVLSDFTAVALLGGDLNQDSHVDESDLLIVLNNFGSAVSPGSLSSGDPTGDGMVGIDDLNMVLRGWTASEPPSIHVPEPTSLVTLAFGIAICIRRRR